MKRLILFLVLIILVCSTFASGYSVFGTLTKGQVKDVWFNTKKFDVTLLDLNDTHAKFSFAGEETPFMKSKETFTFKNKATLSMSEIVGSIYSRSVGVDIRVEYLIDMPTTSCGTTRCLPWEKCNVKNRCDTYCGNGVCDPGEIGNCKDDCSWCGDGICTENEHCGDCNKDCKCDKGYGCVDNACMMDGCEQDTDCDDSKPCTEDKCNNKKCIYTPNKECNVGDICSSNDECKSGYCANNACARIGLLKSIGNWFKKFF
jgi:hypothetical protein